MNARPIAAEAHIDRPLARTVGSTIFISRWLQAPLDLGLNAAHGVYVWRFGQELVSRINLRKCFPPSALDTIVVRGLASAKVDATTTLAESAASS